MAESHTNGRVPLLTKILFAAIGFVSLCGMSLTAFLGSSAWSDLKKEVTVNTQGRELRTERIALLEGRMATIEQANNIGIRDLKSSFERMQLWQDQVREDLASLKAALKVSDK